jgi:hypothetical protein
MGSEDSRFEIMHKGWYRETGKSGNKGNSHYEAARILK